MVVAAVPRNIMRIVAPAGRTGARAGAGTRACNLAGPE
jgi:hypothetical protein